MPSEQKITVIVLHGKNLHPVELTFRQVEEVLLALRSDEVHPVEAMCPEIPVSALSIARSCDIDQDDLMDLTPSQVRELARQVRDANPSLAREIELLASLAGRLAAIENGLDDQELQNEESSTTSSTTSGDPPAG